MSAKLALLCAVLAAALLHALPWSSQGLAQEGREVRIGVLAKLGSTEALRRWTATGTYLDARLPAYRFHIVPLDFQEIHEAVNHQRIDFVLANSAFYVELEKLYGVSRIATLINRDMPGQKTTTFGGVIFCRAGRADLQDLRALKGKSFMAVDPLSFGGWIMAWRELHRQGLEPARFFSSLSYGNTHDAVVHAVASGQVDGGTVRSDTLERMAEDGAIRMEDFRILNERQEDGFPFKLSTPLYPEWPIAAVRSTSSELARQVASALLAMKEDDPAAVASKTAGWTVPLNYQPVHDCLLELRLGPYAGYGEFTLADVLKRYWRQLALLLALLAAAVLVALHILGLHQKLLQKKEEVDDLNRSLEARVQERTRQINGLLDQELYLREIMETVAEVNGLLLSATNLETLLDESCRVLAEHGHYGYSWIGLLQEGKVATLFTASEAVHFPGAPPYDPADPQGGFATTPAARGLLENRTILVEQVKPEVSVTPWLDQAGVTGFRAVVAMPLRADKYSLPLGVLSVYSLRREGFESEEIAMLEELAGDIGFAIHAFNQRAMVSRLEREQTENYEETILSFVNMIDQRDTYTAGHTLRVAHYCDMLARQMGLEAQQVELLRRAATLHDIGKIATPDSVLLKPGKLSVLDYELIKLHACAGSEMLSHISLYKDLAVIIRHHHERYDGMGYPDRLQGEAIPLLSRIIVVADAFDAMTTNRIYKPRKAVDEALRELESLSGKQFDPKVVKAALAVFHEVEVPQSITQLPKNTMEQRRFSYFFGDKLTGLYNEDYLQIILQSNKELHEFRCLHILHLNKLQEYNRRQGWERGNILMQKFAAELQQRYPQALLFRAYGRDFVIISQTHFDIGEKDLRFDSLQDTGIELAAEHLDLREKAAYSIDKLDTFKIQCDLEAA